VHSDVLYLVDSDEDVKPSVMPRIAEWQDRCWAGQRCGGRQQEGSCDVREAVKGPVASTLAMKI
jgi:hypothetical protein